MQFTDTTEGTMTMTTTEDRHVAACRCIWCASDPDKDTTPMTDPHLYCDHNTGNCEAYDEDEDEGSLTEAEIREYELARARLDEEYYNN